ncbi:MAG: trypsin-like peptidase domain-containing protein [Anaerolineae bacterium]|nr:trypsin-like peptidase domain-containing protein [Anaerolineae bacterium]
MTEPTDPKNKPGQSHPDADDELIVTPVNIARARYASAHNHSIVDKTRRVMAIRTGSPQQQPAGQTPAETDSSLFGGFSSCMLVSLLGVVFLVGGILGGIAGGGVVMWASNSEEGAMWGDASSATPLPTPTPAPVETMTPTPSPEPIITPAVEDIIAGIMPSVVTVINQQNNAFALNPEEDRVLGSGVIIDARGYIATNHHVVENANGLSVILFDGREIVAQLITSDPTEDLAIIKIGVESLTPIQWGDSATVRPGQVVYAIGSPLGDFPNSVSFGIISGLNRALEMDAHVIDGLIQTDAAINRGSSGGPLINMQGEMVGINTFIIRESEDRGVAEGIAFAIPTGRARSILLPWVAAHSGESAPIPAGGEAGN